MKIIVFVLIGLLVLGAVIVLYSQTPQFRSIDGYQVTKNFYNKYSSFKIKEVEPTQPRAIGISIYNEDLYFTCSKIKCAEIVGIK